jgi:type I restriction enzyme S subunit
VPRSKKFIIDPPEDLAVKENWLLVTRSGTIGRCILTNRILTSFVISDDMIRIVPRRTNDIYYLYAYLNTWIGQAFLKNKQYGATVKHIEPHHVTSIPIAIFSDLKPRILTLVCQLQAMRNEAQEIMILAESRIHDILEIPQVSEEKAHYLPDGRTARAFEIKASRLNSRLDASYHHPIMALIEENLSKSKYDICPLGKKLKSIRIPPRFKRPYVCEDQGIRYIRPLDLPVIKHFDKLYLAKDFKKNNEYRLNSGEILIVTDGTIGWATLVTDYLDGWYGSNNFARLIPTEDLLPGFLLAYLLSPYGQYQLKREIYGGVIDHLNKEHIEQVLIPIPPLEVQDEISNLVTGAHTKRNKANLLESDCIEILEARFLEYSSNTTH